MKSLFLILCLLLAGCRLTPVEAVVTSLPAPTLPSVRIVRQAVPSPMPTRELRAIETATAVPSTVVPLLAYECEPSPDVYSGHYQVVANVDYDTKIVEVAQTLRYRNQSGETLTDLVLAVQPNSAPDQFQMGQLRFNDLELTYVLEANRLWIPLPVALEDGCSVVLDMTFGLRPPRIGDGMIAFKGYMAYSERQFNLGYWLPTAAPRQNGIWVVHDTASIGEQIVFEQSAWDVTLNVTNAPDGLTIAMPGEVTHSQEMQWRSVFAGGRDFTLSMSADFRVLTQRTSSGVNIEMYALPDAVRSIDGVLVDGAQHALTEATKAFEQYEALFAPYPFTRMAIVQGDFPDGMEFSGLVFVSTSWFYSFKGGYDNYLTLIAVHETSHQWWYAQVGNDAALVPWLDEALATYSEYIYYEEYHPDLKNWWWSSRIAYYNPKGDVDSTVYEFASARDYINAVYLRGVQMLHNLREDIGTEAFFDLLAAYAQRANGQIASPLTFWSLLSPEQWALTADTRGQFFRDPTLGRP